MTRDQKQEMLGVTRTYITSTVNDDMMCRLVNAHVDFKSDHLTFY